MKKLSTILFIFGAVFFINTVSVQEVKAICNGGFPNAMCESWAGEDSMMCPEDCGGGPSCGGIAEACCNTPVPNSCTMGECNYASQCGSNCGGSAEACCFGGTCDGGFTCSANTCTPSASCGNGIMEGAEACDNGGSNSNSCPASCSTSCTSNSCDVTSPTAAITYSLNRNVKSGETLRITATFSEALTDSPVVKIAITGTNTMSATAMTKTDTTHYYYDRTIGAGDGTATVAMSVGTDAAGNVVTAGPTSGSTFVVDNTAPTNQNTVFSASTAAAGGASVTIVSSGVSTNTVWFAPAGTTSFSAGATKTTAGGTATSIAAPATPGLYKLFVLDAAGNISSASSATLTATAAPTLGSAYTGKTHAGRSTNLANPADPSNVSDAILASDVASISWASTINVNNVDLSSAITIAEGMICMVTSSLDISVYNTTTTITTNVDGCGNLTFYYQKAGCGSTLADMRSNPNTNLCTYVQGATTADCGLDSNGNQVTFTDISCSGTTLTFTMPHMDGGGGEGDPPTPEFSTYVYITSLFGAGWFAIRMSKIQPGLSV